jgi:hypothetical protein
MKIILSYIFLVMGLIPFSANALIYFSGVTFSQNCQDPNALALNFNGGLMENTPVIKHMYQKNQGYKSIYFDRYKIEAVDRDADQYAYTFENNSGFETYLFSGTKTLQLINASLDGKATAQNKKFNDGRVTPILTMCKKDDVVVRPMAAMIVHNRAVNGESKDPLVDNTGSFSASQSAEIVKKQSSAWVKEDVQQAHNAKQKLINMKEFVYLGPDDSKNTVDESLFLDACKKTDYWRKGIYRDETISLIAGYLLWDARAESLINEGGADIRLKDIYIGKFSSAPLRRCMINFGITGIYKGTSVNLNVYCRVTKINKTDDGKYVATGFSEYGACFKD